MIAGLAAALLTATAHHLWYDHLGGKEVSNAVITSYWSVQEANTGVGTAFSFLFRTCLAFAVGAALVQVFWRAVQEHNKTKAPTLQDLDAMYGSAREFWSSSSLRVWWRYPRLTIVALTSW